MHLYLTTCPHPKINRKAKQCRPCYRVRVRREATEGRLWCFWSKVNFAGPVPTYAPELGPCWLWQAGTLSNGYGSFWDGSKHLLAHRFSYEFCVGPIAERLENDHLCRVRHCVCPDHLEPVTHRVNVLRGEGLPAKQARQTQCLRGHPYDDKNTYVTPTGRRNCRTCQRDRWAQRKEVAKR